jgi:hypothetical protein
MPVGCKAGNKTKEVLLLTSKWEERCRDMGTTMRARQRTIIKSRSTQSASTASSAAVTKPCPDDPPCDP